jgi:selenocysteine lyase/cysteine desulfurase
MATTELDPTMRSGGLGTELVSDGLPVPCVDRVERPYLNLDAAASTGALRAAADRVAEFLPWYSSVHRGAGYKSQLASAAYEDAREAIRCFAGRSDRDDVAIVCRNTTEAINHLAYRLPLRATDIVLTTVVEHRANLLPWRRVASLRFVECGPDGTFERVAVSQALDVEPTPRLLAVTGASNVTGWVRPVRVRPAVGGLLAGGPGPAGCGTQARRRVPARVTRLSWGPCS